MVRLWEAFEVEEDRAAEISLKVHRLIGEGVKDEVELVKKLMSEVEKYEKSNEKAYFCYLAGRCVMQSLTPQGMQHFSAAFREEHVPILDLSDACALEFIKNRWRRSKEEEKVQEEVEEKHSYWG